MTNPKSLIEGDQCSGYELFAVITKNCVRYAKPANNALLDEVLHFSDNDSR